MAKRRSISERILGSDAYTALPFSAQALYVQLLVAADDEGMVGAPRRVTRSIGATEADLCALSGAGLVLLFASGVCAVTHFHECNYIPESRRRATSYAEELALLAKDEKGVYYPRVAPTLPQADTDEEEDEDEEGDGEENAEALTEACCAKDAQEEIAASQASGEKRNAGEDVAPPIAPPSAACADTPLTVTPTASCADTAPPPEKRTRAQMLAELAAYDAEEKRSPEHWEAFFQRSLARTYGSAFAQELSEEPQAAREGENAETEAEGAKAEAQVGGEADSIRTVCKTQTKGTQEADAPQTNGTRGADAPQAESTQENGAKPPLLRSASPVSPSSFSPSTPLSITPFIPHHLTSTPLSSSLASVRDALKRLAARFWGRRLRRYEREELCRLVCSHARVGKEDALSASEMEELLEIALSASAEANACNVGYLRGIYQNFERKGIRTPDDYATAEFKRDQLMGRI